MTEDNPFDYFAIFFREYLMRTARFMSRNCFSSPHLHQYFVNQLECVTGRYCCNIHLVTMWVTRQHKLNILSIICVTRVQIFCNIHPYLCITPNQFEYSFFLCSAPPLRPVSFFSLCARRKRITKLYELSHENLMQKVYCKVENFNTRNKFR